MGSSSERVRRPLAALAAAVLATAATRASFARVLMTQDKALAEAFPVASIERRTAFLTDEQTKKIEELSAATVSSRVVSYYLARREGKLIGTSYFDTHLVRTLSETVMIVVDPQGAIARIDVLSFDEPPEYLPRPRWFEQFRGRRLDRDLAPGRGVPLVTGATLSSRAVTAAARRTLALHTLLAASAPAEPAPPPAPPAPEGKPAPSPHPSKDPR